MGNDKKGDEGSCFSLQRAPEKILVASGFPFAILGAACAYALITGELWPSPSWLDEIYFCYAISAVVVCHSWLFALAKEVGGSEKDQKRVVKYIEYASILIVAFGLFQVLVSSSTFENYIKYTSGNESSLVQAIRDAATNYMNHNCKRPDTRFFTAEYCAKVEKIVQAKDPAKYIMANVITDKNFLYHPIAYPNVPDSSPVYSNIEPIASRLIELVTLKRQKPDPLRRDALSWIGLLLLPLGIALSIGKTSLELFGGLKTD